MPYGLRGSNDFAGQDIASSSQRDAEDRSRHAMAILLVSSISKGTEKMWSEMFVTLIRDQVFCNLQEASFSNPLLILSYPWVSMS
jgi:hypothetical protein